MEDDFVEHQTRETSFAAQRTNHSANSIRIKVDFFFFFLSHIIVALDYILVNYMHHRKWPGYASNPRI